MSLKSDATSPPTPVYRHTSDLSPLIKSWPENPDPEYEKHKQDALRKQKQGKGHWKPELASDSEEAVKADRADAAASEKEALNKLQERTKGHAEDKAKAGTSMHDSL